MVKGKSILDNQFLPIAEAIAKLVKSKNIKYGNSFERSAEIIKILYPDGIKVEQYNDFLTIIRVIDKLFRIVTANANDEEDPWRDINGYSLLAVERNERSK